MKKWKPFKRIWDRYVRNRKPRLLNLDDLVRDLSESIYQIHSKKVAYETEFLHRFLKEEKDEDGNPMFIPQLVAISIPHRDGSVEELKIPLLSLINAPRISFKEATICMKFSAKYKRKRGKVMVKLLDRKHDHAMQPAHELVLRFAEDGTVNAIDELGKDLLKYQNFSSAAETA